MRALPRVAALFALAMLLLRCAPPAAGQSALRLYLPFLARPDLFVYVSDHESGLKIDEVAPDGTARRSLSGPSTNDWGAVPSPDGRLIAFFSTRDGFNALYLMNRDGSDQRWLYSCNICLRVAWSPDGSLLWLVDQLYGGPGAGSAPRTLRLDLAGGPPLPLDQCLALAPDGASCASQSYVDGRTSLFVHAPATAPTAPLITVAGYVEELTWSPDGRWLSFFLNEQSQRGLYILGLDGAAPRRIGAAARAIWAPQGDAIAFLEPRGPGSPYTLRLAPVTGGEDATLAPEVGGLLGWSPDGRLVAVFAAGDEPRPLLLVPREGGAPTRLAEPAHATAIVWSPDGRRLAVQSYEAGITSLWVVDRDGGNPRRLGEGGWVSWTPDSARLLVSVKVTVPPRLFSQGEDAAAPRPLALGNLPALAPDRRRVAFVREGRLWIVRTDGQEEREPAPGLSGVAQRPAWSPDGRRIAVAATVAGVPALYVVDAEAGRVTRAAGCEPGLCGPPRWSSDGTSLLYTSIETSAGSPARRERIFSVPATGGERRELGQGSDPVWSPDGAQLAYVAGDLFVVNADGTGARQVASCSENALPNPERICTAPTWSADGRWLSYQRLLIFSGKGARTEVVTVDAASGTIVGRTDGSRPHWLGRRLAYGYEAKFGLYDVAYYNLWSSYTKLCLGAPAGAPCRLYPPGHGNMLDYAVAP